MFPISRGKGTGRPKAPPTSQNAKPRSVTRGEGVAQKPPTPLSPVIVGVSGGSTFEGEEASSHVGLPASPVQAPDSAFGSQASSIVEPLLRPEVGATSSFADASQTHNVDGEGENKGNGVFPYYQEVQLVDWGPAYQKCPVFGGFGMIRTHLMQNGLRVFSFWKANYIGKADFVFPCLFSVHT